MLNDETLDHDLEKPDPRSDSDEDLKKHQHNGTLDDRRGSVTRASVDVNDVFAPDLPAIAEAKQTSLAKA